MEQQSVFEAFVHHASIAFFASAYADQEEETGNTLGGEIMDRLPEDIDPAAIHAARTLAMSIERENGNSIQDLMIYIVALGDGDRPNTIEFFGHYAAMQAMGHGVGLDDAFGWDVYQYIRIPYTEFGSYSLERDYF